MSSAKINWTKIKPKRLQGMAVGTKKGRFKILLVLLLLLLVLMTILGVWMSQEPEFNAGYSEANNLVGDHSKTGALTTASIIGVANTLLDKPGGLLSNDVTPPSIFLDNMPAWEKGVIVQVRDISKALRDSFSRSQSQSQEDESLAKADPQFNVDIQSWIFPSSEGEYREGVEYLEEYLDRLQDQDETNAQFFARADNLERYLVTVENRLGSLSQRLSASVGQRRLNTDLAGDAQATQSTPSSSEVEVKTSWWDIDDVFYEARGSSWALIQFLKSIEQDFAPVLENKNATVSLQQIIRELEATQAPVRAPMITRDESIYGFFPNHSLVMASYISRAHAAIIDLRELLARG